MLRGCLRAGRGKGIGREEGGPVGGGGAGVATLAASGRQGAGPPGRVIRLSHLIRYCLSDPFGLGPTPIAPPAYPATRLTP